jgi:uncharacterized protein (DUF885 family)
MPKTRRGLGIGSLPNGKDNYKACLLFHTSIDISPEDVHNKGLSEVARIEKLVRQVSITIMLNEKDKCVVLLYISMYFMQGNIKIKRKGSKQ